MGFLLTVREFLQEPSLRGLDPDTPAFTEAHRCLIERKKLVRDVFADFCRRCRAADERYFGGCQATACVELGSGAGLMKELYPDVITSDVKVLPFVDVVARGEELPFPNASLRAVYGINVFHHFADIESFFSEIVRAVAPGGGCVLIEPYHGPLARILFPNLFTMESYDPAALSWGSQDRARPASEANQALSYVVLRRGLSEWSNRFPQLRLVSDAPHTHLSYLLSGGVNFRQLVPTVLGRAIAAVESRARFLDGVLGLQHTLVILRQ